MLAFDFQWSRCSSERQWEGLLFLQKNLHPNKASKTSFNLTFTQLMNSQTPKYTAHYIYSRVNMYNQSSFSRRIVKFQLRLFKFVFVLQVNVGPLAVVLCDTLCLSFIQKNKNSELLRLINQASQKGKRIAWICNYMKIRRDFGMQAKFLSTST